jgi:hypothetical protein
MYATSNTTFMNKAYSMRLSLAVMLFVCFKAGHSTASSHVVMVKMLLA